MIVDERIVSYINSLNSDDDPIIAEIEQEARENQVPIIRTETKELLKVIIMSKKPERILEVGTAVGFSSIYMNNFQPENGKLVTIEKYEPRIKKAKENINKAGKIEKITLLEGDASDILKEIEEPFDLVFMDAAKGQYINFYPEILRLTKKGGLIISDNVLQDGEILESRFAVTKRNRTIHKRMRDYLYILKHDEQLETVIIPIGDGVAISIKK